MDAWHPVGDFRAFGSRRRDFGGRSREEEKLSLIYIPKIIDETNDFWTALLEGARTAAEEYGVHLEVKAPDSEEDYEGQNALIQEILEREEKPDALIISPVSYTQSTHFLERIKEQGIALVLIDSEVDKDIGDLMVSTDNLEAGKKLGEYVKKILPEGKKVAVVGHVEGRPLPWRGKKASGKEWEKDRRTMWRSSIVAPSIKEPMNYRRN